MSGLTKQSELKNCPQCDYSAPPVKASTSRKHFTGHKLWCLRCEYSTETKATPEEAGAAWNTSPFSAGVREALESAERKLSAYVGVCKGDKELTEVVLPMLHSALSDHGVQKSAGVEAGWRSIESAPRDGTGILVKLPDSDMPLTAKFWRGSWTVAWDHSELKGWDAPTHWMPIPELPSDSLLSKTLSEVEKRRKQRSTGLAMIRRHDAGG